MNISPQVFLYCVQISYFPTWMHVLNFYLARDNKTDFQHLIHITFQASFKGDQCSFKPLHNTSCFSLEEGWFTIIVKAPF